MPANSARSRLVPFSADPNTCAIATLKNDEATMDDCNAIWRMADAAGVTLIPGTLTIGYLVILTPLDVDIDVVYTAEVPGTPSTQPVPTGISIDVNRVPGKRVFVPANTLP